MSLPQSFMPTQPSRGALKPIGIDSVALTGGFWAARQQLNAEVTIPHCLEWEQKLGWIGNFPETTNGIVHETRTGREFADSDVYKLLEGMAWEVGRTGDAALDEEIERIAALIEAAQCDDGYINTKFGNPGQDARYSDFAWGHELYCFGHLFQAAVARLRTGRDSVLTKVALKAADHVCREFGVDARQEYCGHPQVEVGLAELARATGERRYLEQAKIFVERRGQQLLPDIEFGRTYYQDEVPVRDVKVLHGHAVRALYLCAGMIDVAVETGDEELLRVAREQYDATLARRTYITGGMGAHHQDEAFGDDFELPPDRAYSETCAAIASMMCAWRLLLATGDMTYGDVIERAMYNVLATSVSEEGDAFFYAHTLHRRSLAQPVSRGREQPRAASSLRAPWFSVSCCPTNITRTIATLAGFVTTFSDDAVQIHQYIPAQIDAVTDSGRIAVQVETGYPSESGIDISVDEVPQDFHLELRIPAWADGATVDGEVVSPGRFRLAVSAGQRVRLELPVGPRIVHPDPRIDAVRGSIAIEAGPEVLAVESVDLPAGMSVNELRVAEGATPRLQDGRPVIRGQRVKFGEPRWASLAASQGEEVVQELEIPLIPYRSWGNRGPCTMRVWLPA